MMANENYIAEFNLFSTSLDSVRVNFKHNKSKLTKKQQKDRRVAIEQADNLSKVISKQYPVSNDQIKEDIYEALVKVLCRTRIALSFACSDKEEITLPNDEACVKIFGSVETYNAVSHEDNVGKIIETALKFLNDSGKKMPAIAKCLLGLAIVFTIAGVFLLTIPFHAPADFLIIPIMVFFVGGTLGLFSIIAPPTRTPLPGESWYVSSSKKFPIFEGWDPAGVTDAVSKLMMPALSTEKRQETIANLTAISLLALLADCKREEANKLLKNVLPDLTDHNPILLAPARFTDYSGRTFENITAYEYAWWAKDTKTCRMLEEHMNDTDKTEMFKRIENIKSDGLAYTQNGNTFRYSHFDMKPLQQAYDNLSQIVITIGQKEYNKLNETEKQNLENAWEKLGLIQHDMPVHVLLEYRRFGFLCDPKVHAGAHYTDEPKKSFWAVIPGNRFSFMKPSDYDINPANFYNKTPKEQTTVWFHGRRGIVPISLEYFWESYFKEHDHMLPSRISKQEVALQYQKTLERFDDMLEKDLKRSCANLDPANSVSWTFYLQSRM